MSRQLHLNLFVHGRGHHETSWRHPDATRFALTDIRYYQGLAQAAEAALFDSVFFADHLVVGSEVAHVAKGALEPITTLAALAVSTSRIGLIATASTSYTEPFNLARQFASLDHISNGRIGWNIVTTWLAGAAANFRETGPSGHSDRYAQAADHVDAVTKLWDSWADDAVLDDRASGRFADTSRIRRFDHAGPHYTVAGPLNLPRTPQGRPVLVQAGSSSTGISFAARHAEAVFTAHLEKSAAAIFYSRLKSEAAGLGRDPDELVVLPGLSATIGSTEGEAMRLGQELNELADPAVGLARLSNRFGGHDFSHLKLDARLSVDDFPDPSTVQAAQSRAAVITDLVRRERPTLRGLLHSLAGARGHFSMAGTPEQVADTIEDWFRGGAADGFNIMPPILPAQFDIFAAEVVPLLQRRGLFRRSYAGTTLRDHLGLQPPASQFFPAAMPALEFA